MEKRLHILLILTTFVFLSACDKEPIPKINYLEDTPYYPDLQLIQEWNTPHLNNINNLNILYSDTEVVVVTDEQFLKGFDSQTGTILWTIDLPFVEYPDIIKYHCFEGILYMMIHPTSSYSTPEKTTGQISAIDVKSGNLTTVLDYQSVEPALARIINIIPYENNLIIFSDFTDGGEENILNIYRLNLQTKEVSTITENLKSLNHLDVRNPALNLKDRVCIFATLELKDQNVNTNLNVIDLNTLTIDKMIVENYPFSFYSRIHYSDKVAIIVSSENNDVGYAVNIETKETIWRGETPKIMFSHLGRNYGFDRTFLPNLIHHNYEYNSQKTIYFDGDVTPANCQFLPEEHIFLDITTDYNFDTDKTTHFVSLYDLHDGKLLIENRLNFPAFKCYTGKEPDKIFVITGNRIYKFTNPI